MNSIKPLSYHALLFFSCAVLGLFYNSYFWEKLDSSGIWLKALIFVAFVAILWSFMEILIYRIYVRIFLCVIFVISAVSAFYIDSLKIGINATIIESLFNTSLREAKDFLTLNLIWHLLIFAVLPIILIAKIPLKSRDTKIATYIAQEIKTTLKILITLVIFIGGLYLLWGQTIVFAFKNTKGLMFVLNPIAPIRASIDYTTNKTTLPSSYQNIALDAKTTSNNNLFILIIGESQRAANYALNGYSRDTNPYTKNISGLVNFSDFYSCGVITAISIPCMLTNYTRESYKHRDLSLYRDNILDIAKRAGFEVYWISNNGGGCIGGVCNRVEKQHIIYFNKPNDLDSDMLPTIENIIQNTHSNAFIVINLLGSHGARYDTRYPKDFERFSPVCRDETLSNCSYQEIVNAYDNSIIYTDFFVAEVINLLNNSNLAQSGLWLISDHGESLGELGQYMHGGFPYSVAPTVQKHIPSMIWLKNQDEFTQKLESIATKELNHDYLFHTLLSLLNIQTKDYDSSLDMLH